MRLRNVTSPNPELMLAHTTPKMMTPVWLPRATRRKLAREKRTAPTTLILYEKDSKNYNMEGNYHYFETI